MPNAMAGAKAEQAHGISWREAFVTWLRVAALSFGGPAGQIAVMHRILVDEKLRPGEPALIPTELLFDRDVAQLTILIIYNLYRQIVLEACHGATP